MLRHTIYVDSMQTWYDNRPSVGNEELVNLNLFKQLENAIGTFGVTGLDHVIGLKVMKSLQVRISQKYVTNPGKTTHFYMKVRSYFLFLFF